MYNSLKKLASENNILFKKLNKEDQKEIENCFNYVRSKGFGLYNAEIFRKDLIGMYLEHDLRNEPKESLDSKSFCDSVIQNYPKHLLEPFLYCLYQLSIFTLLRELFNLFMQPTFSISIIIIFLDVITFFGFLIIYHLVPRFMFSSKIIRNTVNLLCIFCILVPYLIIYFHKSFISIWLILPSWVALLFRLLFFILIRFFWHYYIHLISLKHKGTKISII